MVNAAYNEVIAATDRDRAGLFAETAARLGTAVQNVEKDFWICWTLDALFNGMDEGSPRLLFKGGTSLSKAFHLIKRFSEDIDITVFRSDIGQPVEAGDLEALSGKQRGCPGLTTNDCLNPSDISLRQQLRQTTTSNSPINPSRWRRDLNQTASTNPGRFKPTAREDS